VVFQEHLGLSGALGKGIRVDVDFPVAQPALRAA
jgi:hypothetical protein